MHRILWNCLPTGLFFTQDLYITGVTLFATIPSISTIFAFGTLCILIKGKVITLTLKKRSTAHNLREILSVKNNLVAIVSLNETHRERDEKMGILLRRAANRYDVSAN